MAIKQSYINAELDWAEEKIHQWQQYMEEHPIHLLQDRLEWKVLKNGAKVPHIIATIEAQGKYIQDMMKNYLSLLSEVNKLREIEQKKKEARGSAEVPHRMK